MKNLCDLAIVRNLHPDFPHTLHPYMYVLYEYNSLIHCSYLTLLYRSLVVARVEKFAIGLENRKNHKSASNRDLVKKPYTSIYGINLRPI